jgi:hypothetical protein
VSRLAPALALVLAALLAWQLLMPSGSEPLGRMPVFTPASLGGSSTRLACPDAAAGDAGAQALGQVPLERLLDALAASGGAAAPEARVALEDLAAQYRALLELRNQRHAWNVETMELVSVLATTLEPAQLDWVLSNRDAVASERLDQGTWRRLGIEP